MPIPKASRALVGSQAVLDLTRVRAGPTCVRQLADWGANVIKIEMPPDWTAGEPWAGRARASDFQNLHRNKRSMTLNLKDRRRGDGFPAAWWRRPTWSSRISGPT